MKGVNALEHFKLMFPFLNGRIYQCEEPLTQATPKIKLRIVRSNSYENPLEKREDYNEYYYEEKATRYFKVEDAESYEQRLCFPMYPLEGKTDEIIEYGSYLYFEGPIEIPDPTPEDPEHTITISFEDNWVPENSPCFEKGSRCAGTRNPALGMSDPTKIHEDDYYLQSLWDANHPTTN